MLRTFGLEMKRWLLNNIITVLIYASFTVSLGFYVRNSIRYNGVGSWPSVPAQFIDGGGQVSSTPLFTRYGTTSTTIDTRFVKFRYSVAGESFLGTKATPNGGLPINFDSRYLRAHYNPKSPEIAVLAPVPFQGTGLLFTAVFTGIIVTVHFWFTVVPLLGTKRRAEQGADAKPDNVTS